MILAFIGNNGTGKTTIAKELEKRLRAIGIEARYKKNLTTFCLNTLTKYIAHIKLKTTTPSPGQSMMQKKQNK